METVAVAQVRPVAGDLDQNTKAHLRIIELANSLGADLVIFPELSLLGYEPRLANAFALPIPCQRLQRVEDSSSWNQLTILDDACLAAGLTAFVGLPLQTSSKPQIGAVPVGEIVRNDPNAIRSVYGKHFLHEDELPYFDPGDAPCSLQLGETKIGLAICYELSVDDHCSQTMAESPSCYVASVAKHESGMRVAAARLAGIAESNGLPTLIANSLGLQDGMHCCGQSAIWSPEGQRLAVLDDRREGVIALNLTTFEIAADQL
ncbi:MAG: carbon-nitrogen hydrolase family protein [Aureliella sp.]